MCANIKAFLKYAKMTCIFCMKFTLGVIEIVYECTQSANAVYVLTLQSNLYMYVLTCSSI